MSLPDFSDSRVALSLVVLLAGLGALIYYCVPDPVRPGFSVRPGLLFGILYFALTILFSATLAALSWSLLQIGESASRPWDNVLGTIGSYLFLINLLALIVFLVDTSGSVSVSDQGVRREESYDNVMTEQAEAVDSWLRDFPNAYGCSALEPSGQLQGEYIEWATGPNTDDLHPSYDEKKYDRNPRDFQSVSGRSWSIHVPVSVDHDEHVLSYTRRDTAAYVVIVSAYAEHTSRVPVEVFEYSSEKGSSHFNSSAEDTVPSVMVHVVDRKTKATLACQDFPRPAIWKEGGGTVYCVKLGAVYAWLDGLGLRECGWLHRESSASR